MKPHDHRFDVAIIGSGIAGSTLGAILARQGLRAILFEANSHPKFAIGESMILETSEMMRSMAQLYDVPELAYFSSENYFDRIGTSQTRLPSGLVSGNVRLNFDKDGSAQGINKDWGRAIGILKI